MKITTKLEIKRVLKKNEDWGFYLCKPLENKEQFNGELTFVGSFDKADLLTKGTRVEVTGELGEYYGNPQIKAEEMEILNADSTFSLESFLIKYVKGVGKKTAKDIVKVTGDTMDDTLKILENPEILDVTKLKESKKEDLIMALKKNFEENDFMKRLLPLGISRENVLYIQSLFPEIEAYTSDLYTFFELRPENPLTISEIDIIIAEYKGLDELQLFHLTAYIEDYLKKEFYDKKNLYGIREEIINRINKYIDENSYIKKSYTREEIEKAIDDDYGLTKCGNKVYIFSVYYMQTLVIKSIRDRLENNRRDTVDLEEYLKYSELGEEQKQAVLMAYREPLSIITGRAGTGKTRLLKTFCEYLKSRGESFILCSYTGKAASTISARTGFKASTIHKAFSIMPNSEKVRNRQILSPDYLIVDEAGLLGLFLTKEIMMFTSSNTRIVLVGDDNQLLPISPGFMFHKMLKIDDIPKWELKKIYRQKNGSGIIRNAISVLDGGKLEETDDFKIIETDKIDEELREIARYNELMDCQIITGVNKPDYKYGTKNINGKIQEAVTIKDIFKNCRFNLGDKIINTKNNYELDIFNGDMGNIKDIVNGKGTQTLVCDINGKIKRVMEKEHREAIELGYAITVHKAQGSEWQKVVVVADKQQAYMFNKNWFYTAITRGISNVTVITDNMETLRSCISRTQSDERVRDDFIKRYNNSKDGEIKESPTTANENVKMKTKELTDEEFFNLLYFGGDD